VTIHKTTKPTNFVGFFCSCLRTKELMPVGMIVLGFAPLIAATTRKYFGHD
jgi:hypothetical protein